MDLYFISFFALFIVLAIALLVVTFNYTQKLLGWFNRHPTTFGFSSLIFGATILYILFNWQFGQIKEQEIKNLPSSLMYELRMNNKSLQKYCNALKTYNNSKDEEGGKPPLWPGYRDKIILKNSDRVIHLSPKNGGLWLQTVKQMQPFKAPQSSSFMENQQIFLCQAMQGRHKFLMSQFKE